MPKFRVGLGCNSIGMKFAVYLGFCIVYTSLGFLQDTKFSDHRILQSETQSATQTKDNTGDNPLNKLVKGKDSSA
jgi:hypothetical protein